MRMTALSRAAVYALMAESRFPKPIRIRSRVVRWVKQEVLDFIASRPRGGSERSGRPGPLLTPVPHRSGRAGSAASGSSTEGFATRMRLSV